MLVDQIPLMRRCGFDSFAPEARHRRRGARARLGRYDDVYQKAADGRVAGLGAAAWLRLRARSTRSTSARASPRRTRSRSTTCSAASTRPRCCAPCSTEHLVGEAAVVSSFGAESAVLLHLVAQHRSDACRCCSRYAASMFPETLAYRDTLVARLGLTDVRNLRPDPAVLAEEGRDRPALVLRSRRLLRDPQGRAARARRSPGSTPRSPGARRFQSSTRAALPRFEIEDGRLKVNPLAELDQGRSRRLFRRARSAAPPARGARLSLDRLRAVHQHRQAGRGSARRPLARLGQGRMRHPQRSADRERPDLLIARALQEPVAAAWV